MRNDNIVIDNAVIITVLHCMTVLHAIVLFTADRLVPASIVVGSYLF